MHLRPIYWEDRLSVVDMLLSLLQFIILVRLMRVLLGQCDLYRRTGSLLARYNGSHTVGQICNMLIATLRA